MIIEKHKEHIVSVGCGGGAAAVAYLISLALTSLHRKAGKPKFAAHCTNGRCVDEAGFHYFSPTADSDRMKRILQNWFWLCDAHYVHKANVIIPIRAAVWALREPDVIILL